jgi:hypothetical protein
MVMPLRPAKKGEDSRRVSGSLDALAIWTRHYLCDEELQTALLPEKVATVKSEHW